MLKIVYFFCFRYIFSKIYLYFQHFEDAHFLLNDFIVIEGQKWSEKLTLMSSDAIKTMDNFYP